MATIKSYTDVQQSKKLAEILQIESADMIHFNIHQGIDGKYHLSGTNTEDDVIPICKNLCTKVFTETTTSDIICSLPCWSLAALLEEIPEEIDFDDDESNYALEILKEGDLYYLSYSNPLEGDKLNIEPQENFVDACYEMILKLHELNLL